MYDHDIEVQIKIPSNMDSGVLAYGVVTIDSLISFPVQWRSYTNKETGKNCSLISFPRRERNGQWEDVVSMGKKFREEVEAAVMEEIRATAIREPWDFPEVYIVSLTPVNYEHSPDAKAHVRGYATIRTCGVTIQGISIKEGEKGLFINMPQYKNEKGEYKDMTYPVSKGFRDKISEAVIEQYQEIQKGIQNGSLEPQTQKERSISI